MDLWKFGPIQILIYIFNFYYFGFWYGILGIVTSFILLLKLFSFFGYEMLSGTDLMQTFDNDLTVQNIAGYTVYDRMKFEDL